MKATPIGSAQFLCCVKQSSPIDACSVFPGIGYLFRSSIYRPHTCHVDVRLTVKSNAGVPNGRRAAPHLNFATQEHTGNGINDIFDAINANQGLQQRNDAQRNYDFFHKNDEELLFALEMVRIADDVKGEDIRMLYVEPVVYWTRFCIIVTAFSLPQVEAMGNRMRKLAREKYGKIPEGDRKPNSWYLLSFDDVVVHLFLPDKRSYYNLEELYANAIPVPLDLERLQKFD